MWPKVWVGRRFGWVLKSRVLKDPLVRVQYSQRNQKLGLKELLVLRCCVWTSCRFDPLERLRFSERFRKKSWLSLWISLLKRILFGMGWPHSTTEESDASTPFTFLKDASVELLGGLWYLLTAPWPLCMRLRRANVWKIASDCRAFGEGFAS